MISKMHPYKEGDEYAVGSKIAIVFNGSPLFSGDAGSGPSNIRRWIIENDWLDAIVALPDQLFYNTGIFTYVWLVTNRKAPERRGKVQLIDGTRFFQRMKKSLNNKRNEITEDQIRELTRLYGNYRDGETAEVSINGGTETRVVSRLFENREFGFLKVTVERPLRMNFAATPERIALLDEQTAFDNLATSKKRKNAAAAAKEIAEGQQLQQAIRALLGTLADKGQYMDRASFDADLSAAAKAADLKLPAPIKKAICSALGERDRDAEICRDGKGRPEPDSELRDTENIPLPVGTQLPLPMAFGPPTNPTMSWWTSSRAASMPTWRPKCCPTCPMPGWTTTRPRSATKSPSTGISTSTNRLGLWMRLKVKSTRWKGRLPRC